MSCLCQHFTNTVHYRIKLHLSNEFDAQLQQNSKIQYSLTFSNNISTTWILLQNLLLLSFEVDKNYLSLNECFHINLYRLKVSIFVGTSLKVIIFCRHNTATENLKQKLVADGIFLDDKKKFAKIKNDKRKSFIYFHNTNFLISYKHMRIDKDKVYYFRCNTICCHDGEGKRVNINMWKFPFKYYRWHRAIYFGDIMANST